jgi:pimeloyl-ACP methyl ester carboxylesterase
MKLTPLLALPALLGIGLALLQLQRAEQGVSRAAVQLDGSPVTVFRPEAAPLGPVVLIAHGFAGSQQLMQSFALGLAQNGYIAVTFDFPGHGRNPAPLTGSITELDGATQTLLAATRRVAAYARPLGDGRLAVLGHSMASDIVVRFAETTPNIAATIAVSMFSPAVTATEPANLLVIVGAWEGMLQREALRAVGLATAPRPAQPGVTYGDPGQGSGRRMAISRHVEHASVLFSQDSLREALAWLDQSFALARPQPLILFSRGPWIMLLLASVVLLAAPLAGLLPRVVALPQGAGLGWRHLALPLLSPMLLTPLLLRWLPTHVLPVLVGDYLAAHFTVYGLLTVLLLLWRRRRDGAPAPKPPQLPALLVATGAAVAFFFIGLVWPINSFLTSFLPGPERRLLVALMLIGTLAYFVSDEWLVRGPGAGRGAPIAAKLAFLVSLALAVALDFERLFFLIIIVPVIALFFIVYGLFGRWLYRATGTPLVAGVSNAVAFAWAIGVTFPLLAG